MGFVTPGKRKLLNSSLTATKPSKRSSQTISGLINTANQSTSHNSSTTRTTRNQASTNKEQSTTTTKRVNTYAKTHIKNNVEFMQKSSRNLSPSSSAKFLSTKLRNNSSFMNNNNIANNVNNKSDTSPKSSSRTNISGQKLKKHVTTESSMEKTPDAEVLVQVHHIYSKENLEEQETLYLQRLNEFKYQLEKLKKLNESDMLIEKIESSLFDEETRQKMNGNTSYQYFTKLVEQMKSTQRESEENLSVVENWHKMQKNEAMNQFNLECSRAVQEFQEKRRELKDGLKNENEDKKRQIEIDRNMLDINMDVVDAKPKVTRKLRRRGNANTAMNSGDFNVDPNGSCLDAIGSAAAVSSSSSLLPNGSLVPSLTGLPSISNCLVSTSIAVASQFNSVGLQATSYYTGTCTSILQAATNPSSSSAVNERKKAKLSAITFTLSEEDINEDLKQLL